MKQFIVFIFFGFVLAGSWYYYEITPSKKPQKTVKGTSLFENPTRLPANQSNNCPLCYYIPPDFGVSDEKVCKDFFAATCDSELSQKLNEKHQGVKDQILSRLEENQNRAAQAMGFDNIDEALKNELEDNGLELAETVPQPQWDLFKQLSSKSPNYEPSEPFNITQIFKNTYDCGQLQGSATSPYELESLGPQDTYDLQQNLPASGGGLGSPENQGEGVPSITSLAGDIDPADFQNSLNETYQRQQDFLKEHASQMTRNIELAYAQDLPSFIQMLELDCEYAPDPNSGACSQIQSIKRQAIQAFRLKGTDRYLPVARKIVGTYTQQITDETKSLLEPKNQVSSEDLNKITHHNMNLCRTNNGNVTTHAMSVSEKFHGNIILSKPFVETTINDFYNPFNHSIVEAQFDSLKADVHALIPQITEDKSKVNRIRSELDSLDFNWPRLNQNPDTFSNEPGFSLPLYQEQTEYGEDNVFQLFESTPAMYSRFLDDNATYSSQLIHGTTQIRKEEVSLTPLRSLTMKSNPLANLQVLAHELGHKLDPVLSKVNGHDLSSEYNDLFECFKESDSINMQDNQKQETLADYISAEVLAAQIARMPAEHRKNAAMNASQFHCLISDMSGPSCSLNHPHSTLRVNGIIAANANLRKAIGCPPSEDYKACGLEDLSLLEGIDLNSSSSTNDLPPIESHDGGTETIELYDDSSRGTQ